MDTKTMFLLAGFSFALVGCFINDPYHTPVLVSTAYLIAAGFKDTK